MKEIELSKTGKNKGKYVVLVDDEDYEYLNQWNWYAAESGSTFYAVRTVVFKKNRKQIKMHRVIMQTPKGLEVDHIDHNGLNNQKSNLRNCTAHENHLNMKKQGSNKYMGVTVRKNGGYITAHICINGITVHLGYFKTEEDAALAYDKVAKETRGEFANLNFK